MQQNLNKKPDGRKGTHVLVPLCTHIVPVSLWDMLTMHISSWSLVHPQCPEARNICVQGVKKVSVKKKSSARYARRTRPTLYSTHCYSGIML